jgi:predicted lysophospholipase L1 biosynthesis ABC-type transport system permease subunit
MDEKQSHLETISEIRSLMERSSRFISLSGLSGVFAGIFALIGATVAYIYLDLSLVSTRYYDYAINERGESNTSFYVFFFVNALCVLIASITVGSLLTIRKAKMAKLSIWDNTAKRLLINLLIPLVAGGLFCLILVYHGFIGMIAPATLLFYGLALINASKYTLNDIRYLGICEIILGLVAAVYIGYGLIFWAVGFGILHIIYGAIMYFKYER